MYPQSNSYLTPPPSPTLPLIPSSPIPSSPILSPATEFIYVIIPRRYSQPSITVYQSSTDRPYETLELTFPTPNTVIPRAILESSTGHLTVLFRTVYGPKCKGGPGWYQEISKYELFLPEKWLGCEQDMDGVVNGVYVGPVKSWVAEHVYDKDGKQEEAWGVFRLLFYGRMDWVHRWMRMGMRLPVPDQSSGYGGSSPSSSSSSESASRFEID